MPHRASAPAGNARFRALLADDHPLILEGLSQLLEPEIEVVGKARNGRQALELAAQLRPELLIVDIAMPGLDGVEVTRQALAGQPALKVLMLSIHQEASWVRAAFEAGASGYLCKTSAAQEIETAVREVLAGNVWISPAVARAALRPAAPRLPATVGAGESLTPREVEILDLLGRSLGNKEIAQRLGVSVTTVRSHLSSIYEKLPVESRVGLALYAAQLRPSAG